MKNITKILGIITLLIISSPVNAVILTFDDIPGSTQNNAGNMPTYQGFNFSSTLDWIDLVGSGWNYGAHSGEFGILNNASGIGVVTAVDGGDFTFDGLWVKKWGTSIESGGVDTLFGTLEGYNNGSLVWSVATGLNGSYKNYTAQSGYIDELRLGFGNNFIVDDIALNETSSIPTPTAIWLFGSGLIGLIGMRKKSVKLLGKHA